MGSLFKRKPGAPPPASTLVERERGDYDFGGGPVPAARHLNPDSSVGGWVAATAHVEGTVLVERDATVSDNARVFGVVFIGGTAVVRGNARVEDGAVIKDRARVTGNAKVAEACVFGDAIVTGHAHVGGDSLVGNHCRVDGRARVVGPVELHDRVHVTDNAWVSGGVLSGDVRVEGTAVVKVGAVIDGKRSLSEGTWSSRVAPVVDQSARDVAPASDDAGGVVPEPRPTEEVAPIDLDESAEVVHRLTA